MNKYEIKWTEGKFWLQEDDDPGPYETAITSWSWINNQAKGFRFGLKYKGVKQRKWRISSAVTLSIEPLLSLAIQYLKEGNEVIICTPDLEILFFK